MKYLSQASKLFAAMSMRERLLAVAALVGVLYFLFDFTVFRPQQVQAKALRETIAQQETELAALTTAMTALSSRAQIDPLAKERAERDELRKNFAQASALVDHAANDVRLGEVIRALVASTPGLTLVSLKTLPVETFFRGAVAPAQVASGAAPPPPIPTAALYKHGVEVVVQGKYLALIPYIQGLERNAKGIFWGSVKMEVVTYPDATLKMTVFTLSPRSEMSLG